MQTKPVITLKHVTFGYDDITTVLHDISMTITQGQIVAIMGGSGSGKTTLLRLISGQIAFGSGEINVFDQNISSINAQQMLQLRKKIGMLFQFGALFTDMSVYENVAFPLEEHTDLPKEIIKKIVAMKLKSVGLFGTQNMFPQELSGGMARRVALARATALDPQLMLYDEPFTGLDPISQQTSAVLIKQFAHTLQQTVILVTHDVKTALEIADTIYFMERGKILASGTPNEILNTTNDAVKQFIEGNIIGPFKYEFQSNIDYNAYLNV